MPPNKKNNGGSRARQRPLFVVKKKKPAPKRAVRYAAHAANVTAFFGFLTVAGILALVASAVFAVVGAYAYFAKDLPSLDQIALSNFGTTRIYDRNGTLLYELVDQDAGRRTYVTLDNISPNVISATVATEDATFYTNPGIEPVAILRAAYSQIRGEDTSGGSTITQQLVRNVLIKSEKYERSLKRKIREALLAYEFSQKFTKDQILEMYLNEIFYGNRSYGIEGAAESYFDKSAKDLTLAEASLLAGLPQSPSYYDPRQNFDAAKARQKTVLNAMVRHGDITREEADEAYAEPLKFKPLEQPHMLAPHFVNYVISVLEKKYGSEAVNAGMNVYTTLDLRYQDLAQQVASKQIERLQAQNAHNTALVAMMPSTGEILAMLGSVDYYDDSIDGQVNVATSERQPGSSFKPITYVTAFKKGLTPGSITLDAPIKPPVPGAPPGWPKNYDGRYHGPVTVRQALGNSLNIPAVKAILYAGVPETIKTAHDMGITTLQDDKAYGPALTLGGGEVTLLDMTTVYSTFANGGLEIPPVSVLKITDSAGKVIEEFDPKKERGNRALSPQLAYMITSILSDNQARTMMFGANSQLRLSRPAAAKTGTTDDNKDAWTLGYTPYLTVGVWMGNTNNEKMGGLTGALGAAYVWHDFFEGVFADGSLQDLMKESPDQDLQLDFVQPEGIAKTTVCALTGQKPTKWCPKTVTDLAIVRTGDQKLDTCKVHKPVKICKISGKLATEFCPPEDVEEKGFAFLTDEYKDLAQWTKEEAPPTEKCDIHTGKPGDVVPYPTGTAPIGDAPAGTSYYISSPTPGQVLKQDQIQISGSAYIPDPNFGSYRLEYTSPRDPGVWRVLGGVQSNPVSDGILGTWDTSGLDDGSYSIRLMVTTREGKLLNPYVVQVFVGSKKASISVKIVSPATGTTITDPGPITIQAQVGGADPVDHVDFLVDGAVIGTAASDPYTIDWQPTPGNHTLQAVAYGLDGAKVNSGPVAISYQPAEGATISITSPADGAQLQPGPVTISVSATGAPGGVRFNVDGQMLAEVPSAPYAVEWNATPGQHTIGVAALDASGKKIAGSKITVSVAP